MKLLFFKAQVILFCIPVYLLTLLSEYYNHKTTNIGKRPFNMKEISKWYWRDVKEALKYNKGDKS